MSTVTNDKAIEHGRLLVGAIQAREIKRDQYLWELADLSAEHTRAQGRPGKTPGGQGVFLVEEWGVAIDWTERGYTLKYLRDIIAEARAWPNEMRVPKRTLGQHADARTAHKNDVAAARDWLLDLGDTQNVRDRSRTISEITGSGPVYKARLKLYRARRLVVSIPATLAKSNILGNEANFDQFRRELVRLRNALDYLDRYVADEMVVDRQALDEALDRILSGEEVA